MNFQNESLPESAGKIGATPTMTEETVAPGLLKKHLAPRGRFGHLVVEEGALQFIWEDDPGNALDADPGHPIVIFPERFHHVKITGKVRFRVEFYEAGGIEIDAGLRHQGDRPGEDFI